MNASLHYEQIEINENKCRYSFEEDCSDLESLEKLVSEHFPKDCPFAVKDFLVKAEKSEIFIKQRIEKLDVKEKILLNTINDIKAGLDNDDFQYIEFDNNKNIKNDNNDYNIRNNMFKAIDILIHKTLHKKKMINGKEVKECNIYSDLNIQLFENEEKKLDTLFFQYKEGNKYFEFITIKSIMISLTNLIIEYVKKYLSKNEKLFNNKINEEEKEDNKIEFDIEKLLGANIFEDIYKDFVFQCNLCSSELEEYFLDSLDRFRGKYQMNFTLSELFTDIFWNIIFHNKKLCILFINSYLNDDIYGDIKICLKKILKIILSVNIPLKHQIVELLGLHQLENYEKNDLMTLIVKQKNKHHNEIVKLEIEKENLNKINNKKLEDEKNNINENNNNNLINNNMKNVESIKYNIITANDISTIKNKNQSLLSVCNNNNMILNKENNIKKDKENKDIKKDENNKNLNKKNKDKVFLDDMEHKTVEEIYNYINDDKIVKNKKKKKSRKNKKNKKEEIMMESNQEEIEDSIVIKFKEDLRDKFIHAGNITKIKPIISENWIKAISNYE